MIAKLDKPSARLRYARQMRDYASAAVFAESCGFIEPTVRSHENGTRKFDEAGAKRYAKALDVPWTWLMVGAPQISLDKMQSSVDETGTTVQYASMVDAGLTTTIRLHGFLTGEGRVSESNTKANESNLQIVASAGAMPKEWVAYKIAEAGMWPFEEGWVLFFAEAELDQCNDKLCLVTLVNGDQLFRRVISANGRHDLHFLVPSDAPILDVKIRSVMVLLQVNMTAQPIDEPDVG